MAGDDISTVHIATSVVGNKFDRCLRCASDPNMINSVLSGFNFNLLDEIQDWIS